MEPGVPRAAPSRLPERVYWIRRAFVLLCLVIVVVLLVSLLSLMVRRPKTAAPAPGTAAPATTTSPSAPDSLQATDLPAPATVPSGTAAASASDQPATAPTSSAPTAAACDPADLTLSVAGPGSVKVGATAPLTVTVTNGGLDSCAFTFDSRFMLKIVSGTDQIWSTTDCDQWAPTGSQTLPPGAAATWQTTWDRHRSQATCKVVSTTLKAGTYVANVTYDGASTAQLVMLLMG